MERERDQQIFVEYWKALFAAALHSQVRENDRRKQSQQESRPMIAYMLRTQKNEKKGPKDRILNPHHIARGHNLRLDAAIRGGAGGAEGDHRVDPRDVHVRVVVRGYGEPGGAGRRGPDGKHVLGGGGAAHGARRALSFADVSGSKDEQVLRVLRSRERR